MNFQQYIKQKICTLKSVLAIFFLDTDMYIKPKCSSFPPSTLLLQAKKKHSVLERFSKSKASHMGEIICSVHEIFNLQF